MGAPGAPPKAAPKSYDLQDGGEYMCQVTVGRSFMTEREANLGFLETVLESTKGAAAPLIMDLYAEQMGGPLGRKMAERFRQANPALQDGAMPPQAMAQIQQMQQQMQLLQQELQQAQQDVKAQTQKAAADLTATKLEIESRERIAAMQIQADLAKTKATLTSKEGIELLKAEEERLARVAGHTHEIGMTRLQGIEAEAGERRHAREAEEEDHRKAALTERHERVKGEEAREGARVKGEYAARLAMTPKPAPTTRTKFEAPKSEVAAGPGATPQPVIPPL